MNENELEDDDLNVTGRWLPRSGNWLRNQYIAPPQPQPVQQIIYYERPPPPPEPIFEMPKVEEYQPPTPPQEIPIEEPKENGPKQDPLRRGIYLKINGLRNFLEKNKTKIRVALVDNTTLLADERNQPCSFETDSYALPELENPEANNYIQKLNQQSMDMSSLATKQNLSKDLKNSTLKNSSMEVNFLEMNEETIFVINIYYYCLINDAWDNIYLVFQILVEKKVEIDPNLHVVDRPMEEAKIENEYDGFTWLVFKCFTNKKLNVGRHLEHNIAPPMEKPPYERDFEKTDDVTDFIIQEYLYDVNQLDDLFNKLQQKKDQKRRRNMRNKFFLKK